MVRFDRLSIAFHLTKGVDNFRNFLIVDFMKLLGEARVIHAHTIDGFHAVVLLNDFNIALADGTKFGRTLD